jgi:putative ABC transport system ATP-binding protein
VASVLVKLDSVSRHYDTLKALDQISLEIRAGEWLSVMGPSGSGKSTLLNLLGALDRPTGGRLWVDGNELSAMSDGARVRFRREKVGIIFQQFHLLPYLTAVENVMQAQHYLPPPTRRGADGPRSRGTGRSRRHLPPQLSGGEQQRVRGSRAANRPPRRRADGKPRRGQRRRS